MDDYHIPETDEALLAECDVDTFRAGGPGGQHQNTTDSAVRLKHLPTGVTVTCRQERSQHLNKRICLERLRAKLETLSERPTERKPTRPSRAAKQRRIEAKKHRSRTKQARKDPLRHDDV